MIADAPVWPFLLLPILLILSAFFSGSETALLGADWLRIRYLARKGDRRARLYEALVRRRDTLIGTILIGNNLVNIAASALATALALSYFGEQGIAVATGVMTALLVVLSEVAPKTFASRNTEKVALAVAPVFAVLSRLFLPAVVVTTFLSNGVLRLLGQSGAGHRRRELSEDELGSLFADGVGTAVEEGKRRMLHGIFRMGRQSVREVMVPRTRVRALEVTTPLRDAVDQFVSSGYTRLPVYRDHLDDLAGIVHVRDALALYRKDPNGHLGAVVRPPLFVPESKDLESLLESFQKEHLHLAVVVDEYGGVEGIVTLEDVLEEIVGEIRDEHDVEGEPIRFLPGGEAMVHAGVSIRDVNERLRLALPTVPDVTLGGFVMTRLRHIPGPGETFAYRGTRFTVARTGRNRVLLIRVSPDETPKA